jgi:hypothetical protein
VKDFTVKELIWNASKASIDIPLPPEDEELEMLSFHPALGCLSGYCE